MAGTTTDWKKMPEIPTAEELLSPHDSALPQILHPGAMTKEEYLEAQYLLHRHEVTVSLRAAVQQIRHGDQVSESKDAEIYTEVRVLGFRPCKSGLAWRIVWKPNLPRQIGPNSQSECLKSGTLVILSPKADSFRTQCLVAHVAPKHSDDLQKVRESYTCEIIWARSEDAVLDPEVELIMLEPKTNYFEPCRHTMNGLQLAASASSRYDKYLFKTKNGASEKNEPVTFDEPVTSHVSADFLRLAPKREPVASPAAVHLDSSQLEAVQQATKQELAIIQGPPGTGKTFTSVVAIDSQLRTMEACHSTNDAPPPIIVTAETNHALDQLLTQCMSAGLGSIVRLGYADPDSEAFHMSLFKLRIRSKVKLPHKTADAKHKQASKVLTSDLNHVVMDKAFYEAQALLDAKLISREQYKSLTEDDGWETTEAQDKRGPMAKWLHHSPVQSQYDPQQPVNNLHEGVHPNYVAFGVSTAKSLLRNVERDGINDWVIRAGRLLERYSDLYQIPLWQRRHIYCLLHKRMQERSIPNLLQAIKVFDIKCEQFNQAKRANDAAIIHGEGIRIIGCTTTGLAKYRGLLEILKPRILLVEEAAETREGSIVAGLMPCIEQLVLVGDHQQLTPDVSIWELSQRPHRITISLFERMLKLEVPFCSLRVQRRMAPVLRQVMQSFYPHIQDHASVKELPLVPGMGSERIWWFDHHWKQSRTDGYSFSNTWEADMIVGFVRYLIQHGMSPRRITVLTYYSGQAALIHWKLRKDPNLAPIDFERSVRTIDGFQGEENDVILLSLVRGRGTDGSPGRVGFLADMNRAVVAMSRARCGLYIFGNMDNALSTSKSSKTWKRVCKAFRDCIGPFLPVGCATHKNQVKVARPSDWQLIPQTGCGGRCTGLCRHGKQCTAPCHDSRSAHSCTCATDGASSPQIETLQAIQVLSKAEGFGPSPPSLKEDAQRMQYETSDAIMDKGSRMFLFGEDAGVGANNKPIWEPEEKLVDDLNEEQDLLVSFSPDSASTKPQVDSTATTTTLQDLWRLDAVSANDEKRRELQKENIVERDGDGPEICQKFVKTVIDANGSRRVAPCSDESLL